MNRTKIEWVRNQDGTPGYTINPVKGLCPMACDYCYARRMYKRFKWQEKVRWWSPAWDLVDTLKKPSRVFVGSTFELFHESLPYNWMEYNLLTGKKYPQHTFIFLTKCPQNLIKWSPLPENCWVGVSVTRGLIKEWMDFDRTRAKVKFVSFEPLLASVSESIHLIRNVGIDWVIIGQQTPVSTRTQPKIEWITEIVDAADKAGIPVFLKHNLNPLIHADALSGQYALDTGLLTWDGELRQEVPIGKGKLMEDIVP